MNTGRQFRCGLLVAALLWAGPASAGQKLALIVGVNRYDHDKLTALRFAVRDATELARVLKGSGGFDVTLLTDDTAIKPTKDNIQQQVKSVLEKCKKGDTAVLAFAGHGAQFEGGADAFFCPSDARPFADRTDSMVSLTGIYKQLEQSFAGVRVLLVDACRDDPTSSRGVNADNTPRPPKGVAALFSCSAGERAFEDAGLRHGVFFHHVLRGLEGEAKDKDGEVTFEGLSAYVRKRVSRQVPELIGGGAKQSPNLKADLSGESPVLVSGLAKQTTTGTTLTPMEFIAFKKIRLTRRSDRPDPQGIIEIHFPNAVGNDDLTRIAPDLATFPGLETIDLGGTQITGAALSSLAESRSVKTLILSDTQMGDDGLDHLAKLKELCVLDLGGTTVGDAGMKQIAKLGSLKRLVLADTKITDQGCATLRDLNNLEFIDLGRTQVTAAGVESLGALINLRRVRVPGVKIPPADMARLRKQFPKLAIEQ